LTSYLSCDVCGTQLEMRADDTPEAIHRRFEQYFEQTHQLIDYFEDLGLLYKVNAARSEQEIFEDIRDHLSKKGY
jgi:adenylate kinase